MKIEASVRVERPIEEVFDFVSDPSLFPRWNSAVQAVEPISGDAGALGPTYSMQRELPSGQVQNELEVFASDRPAEFGIRTTSGPTPFVYRYRFARDGADTVVHLDANVELPGVAGVLGPLAVRAVRRRVEANFVTLKGTLAAAAGGQA